jgi:hypothetical protein
MNDGAHHGAVWDAWGNGGGGREPECGPAAAVLLGKVRPLESRLNPAVGLTEGRTCGWGIAGPIASFSLWLCRSEVCDGICHACKIASLPNMGDRLAAGGAGISAPPCCTFQTCCTATCRALLQEARVLALDWCRGWDFLVTLLKCFVLHCIVLQGAAARGACVGP